VVVLISSVLFGISTLISWALYGEQCAAYLWGPSVRRTYRILYCTAILGGALGEARVIWAWGDFFNGVMAIPNLIALLALGGELAGMLQTQPGAVRQARES
jgi:AGCS family alanine or glycine:cation symporter